jgi:hypothetical protein
MSDDNKVISNNGSGSKMEEPTIPPNPLSRTSRFRIAPAYIENIRKPEPTILVQKPGKFDFFRTHPSFEITTCIVEVENKGDLKKELYVVEPLMLPLLEGDPAFEPRLLVGYVTRDGDFSLWPMKVASKDGKVNEWITSAHEVTQKARTEWVRLVSNMRTKRYEAWVSNATGFSEPEFPSFSVDEALERAFKHRVIDSPDHAVVKILHGGA